MASTRTLLSEYSFFQFRIGRLSALAKRRRAPVRRQHRRSSASPSVDGEGRARARHVREHHLVALLEGLEGAEQPVGVGLHRRFGIRRIVLEPLIECMCSSAACSHCAQELHNNLVRGRRMCHTLRADARQYGSFGTSIKRFRAAVDK